MHIRLLLLALLLGFVAPADAFDFDAYKPADLATVAPTVELTAGATLQILIDAAHPRYKTLVQYTGNTREISSEKREFVRHWVKSMGHPSHYENLFPIEVEVLQAGRTWWLPMQGPLVQAFKAEVATGRKVHLYVLLMGAVNGEAVFSVSEFSARPNHSLNHRTHYGGLSWPGLGYTVHFPNPGQAIPPQRSG